MPGTGPFSSISKGSGIQRRRKKVLRQITTHNTKCQETEGLLLRYYGKVAESSFSNTVGGDPSPHYKLRSLLV